MKRKYLLFFLPLLVPVLAIVFARLQTGDAVINLNRSASEAEMFAILSQELKNHPHRRSIKVRWSRSYSSYRAKLNTTAPVNEIRYNRLKRTVLCWRLGTEPSNWDRVSETAIHEVARNHGNHSDLAHYGARNTTDMIKVD